MSQGPTCSLPLRPLWYRLTIAWVPRYLIMLTILVLYVAIYVHVGLQFGSYGILRRRSHMESVETNSIEQDTPDDLPISPHKQSQTTAYPMTSCFPAVGGGISTIVSHKFPLVDDGWTRTNCSESGHINPGLEGTSTRVNSRDGFLDRSAATDLPNPAVDPPTESPAIDGRRAAETQEISDSMDKKILTKEIRSKRNAIRRQLWYLFIYPLLYFVLWLPPFVQHLMNYSNHWVQHPVFGLSLLVFACISSMGAVDCIVFSLREKPWRHIPGSDGTFLGSFLFWQHGPNHKNTDTPKSRDLKRTSAVTDFAGKQASIARSFGCTSQLSSNGIPTQISNHRGLGLGRSQDRPDAEYQRRESNG